MNIEVLLRKQIALAQVVPREVSGPDRYGEGFNYMVEAEFPLANETAARQAFDRVLNEVDHKNLGLDLDLGFLPKSSVLGRYLFKKLAAEGIRSLTLRRGDGLVFSCYGQP